jgi:hypothetical protein
MFLTLITGSVQGAVKMCSSSLPCIQAQEFSASAYTVHGASLCHVRGCSGLDQESDWISGKRGSGNVLDNDLAIAPADQKQGSTFLFRWFTCKVTCKSNLLTGRPGDW